MDYLSMVLVTAMCSAVISVFITPGRKAPMLLAISYVFLRTCILSLVFMVLIEANEGWNDDMLAPYAFLESFTLIAFGLRYLVEHHTPWNMGSHHQRLTTSQASDP